MTGETSPTPATPGLLRSLNDRVVLDLLLAHKTLSRGDVRRLTGVSKPTASQLLSRLEESGHVLQSGYADSRQGGRASLMYELNPRSGFAAALNVTPEGVHARIANVLGTVIGESRHTTAPGAETPDPDTALATLGVALAASGIVIAELSAIVIAAPGSYDAETDVLRYASHLSSWQEVGLLERMRGLTGVPVYLENDVNLVAVAEHRMGAVRDVEDFFLFWVEDRIGGALMIGNRMYSGSGGGSGEVAFLHVPGIPAVRYPVRENRGGFGDLVSEETITALAAEYGLAGNSATEAVAGAVALATPDAEKFLTELGSRYAIGLSSVIAILDPAVIVLAGSTMAAGGETLRRHILAEVTELAIAVPRLALGEVTTEPIIAGALLTSLDLTRGKVFST